MSDDRQRLERTTYRHDLVRSLFGGLVERATIAFAILAAVRHFDAPDVGKAMLAAAFPIGLLFTPYLQRFAAATGLTAPRICAWILVLTGLCYSLAAFAPGFPTFTLFFVAANILLAQQPGLILSVYSSNYRSTNRSRLVANALIVSGLASAVLALAAGWALDRSSTYFTHIFLAIGICAFLSALAVRRMPGRPMTLRPRGSSPRFGVVQEDPVFRQLLAAWMLMGLANLMMVPMRVEHLANPAHGLTLSNSKVILLTLVIFALGRIAGLRLFGHLFGKLGFLTVRNTINGLFLGGTFLFFNFDNLLAIGAGSALFGLGMGGGNLAWNIWVLWLAPPDRQAEYMNVHTALTGLRGVLAPFLAYGVAMISSPRTVSWIAMAMLGLAVVLFLRVRRLPTADRLWKNLGGIDV